MKTLDFLTAILPGDCWYFIATPHGKVFSHTACRTIEEMAHRIGHLEANQPTDIYYACSGYREEFLERTKEIRGAQQLVHVHRTKDNVKLVKAFWLDLDVGPAEEGKAAKYADKGEAIRALHGFLKQSGLPDPMVVSSGYGIHVYWPLTTALLPGQWRATALQLKALTVGLGMLTDPTRTSDEASVLRPVGTMNRKVKNGVAGSVPVTLLYPPEGKPVTFTDPLVFHNAITAALGGAKIEVADTDKSGGLKVNPSDLITPVGGFKKVSALKVAEKCQQIRLFKETGGVSEPHWYRSLGVIQHTIEGEPLAHEWSKSYQGYTPAETDQKLAQLRPFGPTLCATFAGINPEGCKNCPFATKISTPLQLGLVVDAAPAPLVKQIIDGEEKEIPLPPPPYPFKRGSDDQPGLYIELDQGVPVCFYPYDLFPYEIINDAGTRTGSVAIRHSLPKEGWKKFSIPLAYFESQKDFIGTMRNNFVNPINSKHMVAYMDAYLRQLQDQTKITQLHTKLGWVKDEKQQFLLGSKLYTPKGTYTAGVSATISKDIIMSYHAKGEHDAWQAAIRRFDRVGLEAHLFSILIGFAAPLFKITGFGGVIASMRGVTNAGKTLAARAMTSIYGDFKPFQGGNNDTVNARMERLGILANLPVYLDEMTNVPSEVVSDLMYSINQGVGRMKLNRDSTIREPARWNTIVLTSGNRSMAGKLMEAKVDPEAELVRLFEYAVHKHAWFEPEMSGLYDVLDANYGQAGEKYLKYIVQIEEADLKAGMKKLSEAFAEQAGREGKERFWYALIGAVLYGLWCADAAGALKLDDMQATYQRLWTWARTQVEYQRGIVTDNKLSAIEALSLFLNAHIADRLVIMEAGGGVVAVVKPPAAHGKLGIEYNQTTGVLTVGQALMRNWFNKNQLNPHQIKQDLMKDGIMIRGDIEHKHTLGRGTQFQGGQTRVVKFDAKNPALGGAVELLIKEISE